MAQRVNPVAAPRAQKGVVLFIALIVLVAMSLAGLAIMRSVGSGVLVASNLAFKQTTMAGAERGVEEAKAWLLGQSGAALEKSIKDKGYFSAWGAFDPLKFNWDSDQVVTLPKDDAGTEVRYVIHRLCLLEDKALNATGQQCVLKSISTSSGGGGSAGGVQYGSFNLKTTISPYYRVTVRSNGPKSAVSYVQVIFD